ncbi:S1 family peptidase, partial [Glycomyces sp. NRRL B-16210]|uniref:S1 family peptidase n=1 Tax=Glycomyces sp. NRRL B-16210 TaxID=1463821 RepID=UPI0004C201D5
MKRQRALAVTAASALVTTLILGTAATPASAEILDAKAAEARAELTGNVSPGLITQLAETFDLTESQAYDRLAVESVAADLLEEIPQSIEDSYAGLWVSEAADEIFVATTDPSDVNELRAEGATPILVDHDLATLEAAAGALDHLAVEGHYGHYIDLAENTLVIETADSAVAEQIVAASGIDPALVTVDAEADAPQTFYVRGGDSYIIENSWRCSVGFAVRRGSTPGFVTAGHCGSVGNRVTSGEAAPGTFQASVFPGSDAAWVSVGASEPLYNQVNMYSGTRYVYNSSQAAVGSSICRSGSTTGWYCGTVQAFNQTVNYAEGTVRGLTRTNVCAEPGDSGGSFITGNSAQGMTSGGSGNCRTGGTTYFQPIGPALSTWGLTLVTS